MSNTVLLLLGVLIAVLLCVVAVLLYRRKPQQAPVEKTPAMQQQGSHEVRLTYEQLGTLSSVVIIVLVCLVALVGCLWLTPWGDVIVKRVNGIVDAIAILLGLNSGGVGASWIKGLFDRRGGPPQ